MTIETYMATLQHYSGRKRLKVVSLSGEQGAKAQIMAAEHCPECAIAKMKKIDCKEIR